MSCVIYFRIQTYRVGFLGLNVILVCPWCRSTNNPCIFKKQSSVDSKLFNTNSSVFGKHSIRTPMLSNTPFNRSISMISVDICSHSSSDIILSCLHFSKNCRDRDVLIFNNLAIFDWYFLKRLNWTDSITMCVYVCQIWIRCGYEIFEFDFFFNCRSNYST